MAQQGCASVLLLWRTGLLDLEPTLRDKCEKVYGALLAARGPLRGQPGLRARLIDMLDASPDMWMHGGRLYVAMVNGLPFIPVDPHMSDIAQLRYNRVMGLTLSADESIEGVTRATEGDRHVHTGRCPVSLSL